MSEMIEIPRDLWDSTQAEVARLTAREAALVEALEESRNYIIVVQRATDLDDDGALTELLTQIKALLGPLAGRG